MLHIYIYIYIQHKLVYIDIYLKDCNIVSHSSGVLGPLEQDLCGSTFNWQIEQF